MEPVDGWLTCTLNYSEIIYPWYPRNPMNQLEWRVRVRDADGNESIFPFTWVYT
jgi:hypothetical protein